MSLFSATETTDWIWFEDLLGYDNARLPQALIQTGLTTHTPPYVEVGLRSLSWLMSFQTTSSGYFRPVGTKSFGRLRQKPEAFDQQPIEASATISACLVAWRADDSAQWQAGAMSAFGWFLGENDLQTTLINLDTGSCSDGLHPDRPNENKGAESALSYLLSLVEIRQLNEREAAPTGSSHLSRSKQQPSPLVELRHYRFPADELRLLWSCSIGVGRAALARPDGYTIVLGVLDTHVLNGAFYSLQYDVLNDFAPVAPLITNPITLFARKTLPANTCARSAAIWRRGEQLGRP
jgi:hypothetical protein